MITTESRADAHEAMRTREQKNAESGLRRECDQLREACWSRRGPLLHVVEKDGNAAWARLQQLEALVAALDGTPKPAEPWSTRSAKLEQDVARLTIAVDELTTIALADRQRLARLDWIGAMGLDGFAAALGETVADTLKQDRLVWAGPWESNKSYSIGHVVRFDSSIWRCAVETETKPAPDNPMWQLVLPGRTKP